MIRPKCYICKKELDELGGLLLSPPKHDGSIDKRHICVECYRDKFMEKYI
jgi:hypothetical protein